MTSTLPQPEIIPWLGFTLLHSSTGHWPSLLTHRVSSLESYTTTLIWFPSPLTGDSSPLLLIPPHPRMPLMRAQPLAPFFSLLTLTPERNSPVPSFPCPLYSDDTDSPSGSNPGCSTSSGLYTQLLHEDAQCGQKQSS